MTTELAAALEHLDRVTRRLRRECPWDREQDARSIVPHTVEEAYELADAAGRDDAAAMRDEIGDVLFQVVFLALLLEERGEGDLPAIAEQLTEKLIRRHPHVFEDAEAETPGAVRAQWERIKREREGGGEDAGEPFAGIPENLPALLYARKAQRRADPDEPQQPPADERSRDAAEEWIGDLLFAAVALSRRLGVDPELALRAATARFAERSG